MTKCAIIDAFWSNYATLWRSTYIYKEKGRKMEDPMLENPTLEDPMLKLEEVVERLVTALDIERSDYINRTQSAIAPELDSLAFVESACVGRLVMSGYAAQEIAYHGNFLLEFVLAINSWCRDERTNWSWLTPEYPRYDRIDNKTMLIMHPTNEADESCSKFAKTINLDFEQLFKPRLIHIIRAFLINRYYGYGLYAMLFEAEREGFISPKELHELVKTQLESFLLLYGILPAESKEEIGKATQAKNAKEFEGIRKHKRKRRKAKREELIARIDEQIDHLTPLTLAYFPV